MSYNTISDMAQDVDLRRRMIACAATQRHREPEQWVAINTWALVTQPGWEENYKYAQDTGNVRPGFDESVISDQSILSSIQLLLAL